MPKGKNAPQFPKVAPRTTPRPGEGVQIVFKGLTSTPMEGGVTLQAMQLDLRDAQVPERRYPADSAGIIRTDEMVRLLFGQRKLQETGFHTLLVIHLSFLAARQFLKSMEQLAANAAEYLAKHNAGRAALTDGRQSSEQTVALAANVVAAAFNAREACLDFYHASPFVLNELAAGGKFFAEPVVRVTLMTPLMMALYEALSAMRSQLPA